jgi:signal transduction histidine kinase
MRPTVIKKMIFGMVLVLILGTGAMLVIYHGLKRVDQAMAQLTDLREPLSAATHEMEININGISLAVARYLIVPAPGPRELFEKDEADFRRFQAQYLRLAETEREMQLGREVEETFEQLIALGRELMGLRDRQDVLFGVVTANFEKIDSVLDRDLEARIDRNAPDGFVKLEAIAAAEADLAEVGIWLANYQRTHETKFKDLLAENEREFRATLTRLKRVLLPEEEKRHVVAVEKLFEQTIDVIGQVLETEAGIRAKSDRLVELRSRIDGLIDEEMQVLTSHHLLRPRQEANAATTQVLTNITWLIPLFVIAVGGVAVAVIRSISVPLRKLTEGTAAVRGGDLTFRIVPTRQDEFAELAGEFNRMVARLEATTVSKVLLEESEGKLRNTVTQLRQEILDRQQAEAEQRRLETALRRAEILSAMGILVAGVAHQVRNPLFAISSILDAMAARLGARPEYERYLTQLREPVSRLTELMRELMEYGRPPGAEMAPDEFGEVLAEAVNACGPLAERLGVRVEVQVAEDLGAFVMDRRGLVRVFENLVENALRYSEPGGAVSVCVRQFKDGDRAWVECRVSDTGPGFPSADLSRVFDPFFSKRPGGTGLGLAIAQRIVEDHGGEIMAANRPGGGAVMTVKLPYSGVEMATSEG